MESNNNTFLKVLCYLTILYSVALIGICLYGWFAPDSAGDAIDRIGQINIGLYFAELPVVIFYLPMILVAVFSLLGAVFMLQLKQIGYKLYTGASIFLLAACVVLLINFGDLFGAIDFVLISCLILLIVLFGTQRKALS